MIKNPETRNKINIKIDYYLIIPFFLMIFSGFLLQICYHMRRFDDLTTVWGLNRAEWLLFHKVMVCIIVPLTLAHLVLHYKWFLGVIKKKLFVSGGKQVRRTFILFILFIIVSITGLAPWLLNFDHESRHHIIEIHDKIAIFFTFLFIYHFALRHNKIADYLHKERDKKKQLKTQVEQN